MLKLGFYACPIRKKLIIIVELVKKSFEWGSEELIEVNEEIQDEYDYYTKYKKFDSKVLKYSLTIFPYINGVIQSSNQFILNKDDQIEIKYIFERCGIIGFDEYMSFLHEAYKMDSINTDLTYSGIWPRNFDKD